MTHWKIARVAAGILMLGWLSTGLLAQEAASAPAVEGEGTTHEQRVASMSQLGPSALLQLANRHKAGGAAREDERRAIAAALEQRMDAGGDEFASVGLKRWHAFAGALAGDLSETQRKKWAQKIQGAFAPSDAALAAMPPADVRTLADTVEMLGEQGSSADLAWKWTLAHKDEDLKADVQAGIATMGLKSTVQKRPEKLALLQQMDRRWVAQDTAEPLDAYQCQTVSRLWWEARDIGRCHNWAMRCYSNTLGSEQARAEATPATLGVVGHVFVEFGLTGKGKDYPGFAQVLARLAREGKLQKLGYVPFYADPLGSAASRQRVRAELADPQGHPRLAVARIVTRATRQWGDEAEFAAWAELLAARVDGAANADTKALWIMAKGETDQYPGRVRRSSFKRTALEKALATATSPQVRLMAVNELVELLKGFDTKETATQGHEAALTMVQGVKEQFQGQQRRSVTVLEQELKNAIAARGDRWQTAKMAQEVASRRRNWPRHARIWPITSERRNIHSCCRSSGRGSNGWRTNCGPWVKIRTRSSHTSRRVAKEGKSEKTRENAPVTALHWL